MPGQASTIRQQIDIAFNAGTVVGLTDRQLVERFAARRDPIAEVAFAALVRRHGPMVLRVCRKILRNHHDAQDAFQATFLILARKAESLWVEDSLGPWLHGVACRVASTSKAAAARRRAHESKVARLAVTAISEKASDDSCAILHEELARLPDRYRATIVLCDLEGRTYEEAAWELGRPVGTIKSRLARGRERLRIRMMRRGVVPTAFSFARAMSVESSGSALSVATIDAISRRATRLVAGCPAKEVIPSAVLVLTEGVLKTMVLSKL
jgi:RNA polymerase sigma factor (sigma-70 family)